MNKITEFKKQSDEPNSKEGISPPRFLSKIQKALFSFWENVGEKVATIMSWKNFNKYHEALELLAALGQLEFTSGCQWFSIVFSWVFVERWGKFRRPERLPFLWHSLQGVPKFVGLVDKPRDHPCSWFWVKGDKCLLLGEKNIKPIWCPECPGSKTLKKTSHHWGRRNKMLHHFPLHLPF